MKTDDIHDVLVMLGHSVLGEWIDGFVRAAYNLSIHATEVHLGDGAHILPDIGRRAGAPRAMMMLGPGQRQMQIVRDGIMPVVVVIDDAADSIRHTMATKQSSFLDALRLQTRYAAAHYLYFRNPAALVIERHPRAPARDMLSRVIAHLALPLADADRAALVDHFGGGAEEHWSLETALARHVPSYAPLEQINASLSGEQLEIVRQVLAPLLFAASGEDIGTIIWASKVFTLGDTRSEVERQVIDITGPARTIFYGPYFYLPPGTWRVSIVIGFTTETKGMPFRLLLHAQDRQIAEVQMRPEHGGAFVGSFSMRHVDPEHFIEAQFRNDEGLIEGHLALGQIAFTKLKELGRQG